jgi:adenine deaminase
VANLDSFIRGLPKAELHMHLEGSIEPGLMLDLAKRNGMVLRWATADELRAAYQFTNLQSFLDLYFEGCRVLVTRQDFHDVTRACVVRIWTAWSGRRSSSGHKASPSVGWRSRR